MKAVLQRVKEAKVTVDGQVAGSVGPGLLILLGIHKNDDASMIDWLVNKIVHLRIFQDEAGKMNLSVKDIGGGLLVVSQFTLYANASRGRRPDFIDAADPGKAEPLYLQCVDAFKKEISNVQTGIFGACMEVSLVNDGPVTLILEQ